MYIITFLMWYYIKEMKYRLFLLILLLSLFMFSLPIAAENLNSSNYVLIDPQVASTAGSSSSANYKALTLAGSGIGYSQLSSSLYKIGSGQGYTFMANVPKVTCFETDTNSGTTECASLPAGNGMIGECGETGCYDRAMVQIDVQANPSDTVFSIQVSSDDFVTIFVVDGTTHALKPYSSKTISDYKTKTQWEGTPWNHYNIVNLQPNTTYKARITALQGDFTESTPGPSKTATTSMPAVTFDLDIGADINAESNAPYAVALGIIVPETAYFPTPQRIKMDISTNAQNGVSVYIKDTYSGLRSASTSYTLQSNSEDLSNPANGNGFGIQESGATQSGSSLGSIVTGATYDVSGSNVGEISSVTQTRVACSLISPAGVCGVNTPTWVTGGKMLLTLGVRATLSAPAVKDYADALTFTVTGGW